MKKVFLSFVILLLSISVMQAQHARIELSFSPMLDAEALVYAGPRVCGDAKSVRLRNRDGVFAGRVDMSSTGFYDIVVVKDNAQLITTVYVGETDKVKFAVEIVDKSLKITDSADNRVLTAYNATVASNLRTLWTKQGLNNAELKSIVTSYSTVADSLLSAEEVSAQVKEFVKVWAYTAAYDTYASIPRAQGIDASAIDFAIADVLPKPQSVLDCDYTSLFYSANLIISSAIPSNASLMEKMNLLYDNYSNDAVRAAVGGALMRNFITSYNYSADFEGGLAQVRDVVAKCSLSDEYVKEYLKRKATIVGSAFPQEIVLQDAQGNVVDFSTFKGKYVYIDLWASWCGPCRKEIPHLQELEEAMKDSDIVFLSISTDADSEAWKKSMDELGLHGNQLHDRGNTLCDALNVKGIPFFLVYDKEGRLHTYGAMRPSKGALLKEFLGSLK